MSQKQTHIPAASLLKQRRTKIRVTSGSLNVVVPPGHADKSKTKHRKITRYCVFLALSVPSRLSQFKARRHSAAFLQRTILHMHQYSIYLGASEGTGAY